MTSEQVWEIWRELDEFTDRYDLSGAAKTQLHTSVCRIVAAELMLMQQETEDDSTEV